MKDLITDSQINLVLQNYPKVELSPTPTPIYKMPRLSSYLGHNIYIMRDDLTGFALGGNKIRKLEYLVGDALKKNATTFITSGASSFSRNVASAGKAFGFDVHVFVFGEEEEQNKASQAHFELLETRLHFIPQEKKEILKDEIARLKAQLEASGELVYVLHPGGSDEIGTLSYINAFEQIDQFSKITGIHFEKIIHTTGSAATQAGLVLGQCISGYQTTIIGMAVAQPADMQSKRVTTLAHSTAEMLEVELDPKKVIVEDRFIGPGYPIPSIEGAAAMKLFASLEGVMLSPAYTAKAAAGLINYALNDNFEKEDNILFVHTGGNSGLFD